MKPTSVAPIEILCQRINTQTAGSTFRTYTHIPSVFFHEVNIIAKQLEGMRRGRLANLLYNAILNHSALCDFF